MLSACNHSSVSKAQPLKHKDIQSSYNIFYYIAPEVQCSEDSVQKTVFRKQCSEDSVQKTVFRGQCSEDSVQKTVFRGKCSEDSVQRTVFRRQCSEDSVQKTVFRGKCSEDSVQKTVFRRQCGLTSHEVCLMYHVSCVMYLASKSKFSLAFKLQCEYGIQLI